MGKKSKHGKSRKDKFYFLAKETGFRARSAFKLIQLNRRFNFLGSSKVLIDLCAAPGGWMQVAAKEMPVGSLIVGVDLVPIMPIPNCKSIVADITTEKCRQLLRAAILNNKADVILHDGAPNVGTAWTIDEYSQAVLCLKAFSLATELLRKGGWFITKVFRSRDYEPLKWVVSQFFRKVKVLKPEASRQESAEIFLVGQGYLDPTSIDPKFLDPKHVFGEIEVVKSRETVVASLLKQTTKRKKAEGYDDDKLYKETSLSEFMNADDPLQCLAKANKIVIDREDLLKHPLTPSFIRESLSDIKVLGKSEIRAILAWRRKLLAALDAGKRTTEPQDEKKEETANRSADEEEEVQREVERLLKDEQKATKKRLKTIRKARRKIAERIVLKMEHPGDVIEENSAGELFSLASIGGRDLKRLEREEARLIAETGHSASDLLVLNEEKALKRRLLRKRADDFRRAVEGGEYLHFDRNAEHEIDLGALESTRPINPQGRDDLYLSSSDDEDTRENLVFESDDDGDNSGSLESDDDSFGGGRIDDDMYAEALANADSLKTKNHVSLLTDLDPEDEETKKSRKIESWCHSAELKRLMDADESGDEEDVKWQDNAKVGIRKRVSFADDPSSPVRKNKTDESQPDVPSSDEEEVHPLVTKRQKRMRRLRRPLTAEERALATKLIQSAKSRRDLLEWNFHRYRFFEDESSLPEWFAEDERKHMRKAPPVEDTTGLATRPIQGKTLKKAEEAKARKRIKLSKRLSSVRKRAENLPDDLTEREAWSKIKSMYKNAGLLKKKRRPTNYVVNTKDGARNTSRTAPRGAKVKLVDRRMKSDLRGQAKTSAKRGRKGNAGKRRDKRAKRRGAQ